MYTPILVDKITIEKRFFKSQNIWNSYLVFEVYQF